MPEILCLVFIYAISFLNFLDVKGTQFIRLLATKRIEFEAEKKSIADLKKIQSISKWTWLLEIAYDNNLFALEKISTNTKSRKKYFI